MELRPETILQNKYVILKKIGHGCFGSVFLSMNKMNNQQVAVKQVFKSKFQMHKVQELFFSEVNILRNVKNENVVGFIDYFESKDSCFLVLEYCDSGDLDQYLQKKKFIPEAVAVEYFKQLLNGFKGLHQIKAAHRDLKAANILIHNKYSILKIADLGFGKILQSKDVTRTVLGTSVTMAPEVLEKQHYGLEVDLYSLGIILYQMLFGTFPYKGENDNDLLQNIKTKPLILEHQQIKISEKMKDLLRRMICYERKDRIKWHELYKHSVFVQPTEKWFLAKFQNQRISLEQNGKFYNDNKDFMDKEIAPLNPENPSKMIEPEVAPGNQQEEIKRKEQDIEKAKQENIIQNITEKYIYYRNLYGQLMKTVNQPAGLPEIHVNFIFPIFLIQKKLFSMYTILRSSLEKKESLFKIDGFDLFFKSIYYTNCLKLVKEEEKVIMEQYNTLKAQVQEMASHMIMKNPIMNAEIASSNLTENFKELFRERLITYQQNLEEERPKFSPKVQQLLFCHEWCVLDAIQMDNYIEFPDHEFEKRNEEILEKQYEEYEGILQEKLASLF